MVQEKPVWVKKFKDTDLGVDWCDRTLSKYSENLLYNLPISMSPERFALINPLQIQEHEEIAQFIDVPKNKQLPDVLLFILDMLSDFAKAVSTDDSDIYGLYKQMDSSPEFYTDYDFPQFYLFCRRIQYVDISSLQQYEIISTFRERSRITMDEIKDEEMSIEYNDENLEVRIKQVYSRNVLVDVLDGSDREELVVPLETIILEL
jgi:hypothetical protein